MPQTVYLDRASNLDQVWYTCISSSIGSAEEEGNSKTNFLISLINFDFFTPRGSLMKFHFLRLFFRTAMRFQGGKNRK